MKRKIENAKNKLFEVREKRVHPFKDDKILTDWNSLMISALAKAARTFHNAEYLSAAEKAMKFILVKMITEDGKLFHRFRNGEAGIPASVDDYSFVISALIDLYETSFKTKYLKDAFELNEVMIKHFWDNDKGGFFFSGDDTEQLLFRQKEIYDGAIPSGNSAAILNLLKLSKISGNIEYANKASQILKVFSKQIDSSPSSFSQTLIALDFAFGPSFEIVISYGDNAEDTKEVLGILNQKFLPNKIVILNSFNENEIKSLAPFVANQNQIDNKPTIYFCKNYQCSLPITNSDEFRTLLDQI